MAEEIVCNLEYIEVKKKCMNKLHIYNTISLFPIRAHLRHTDSVT